MKKLFVKQSCSVTTCNININKKQMLPIFGLTFQLRSRSTAIPHYLSEVACFCDAIPCMSSYSYLFFNYPNKNCTVGVRTLHNCATGNFSSAALLFSVRSEQYWFSHHFELHKRCIMHSNIVVHCRSMGLLNNDSFKMSTKSRDGSSQTVLAWFTKKRRLARRIQSHEASC